MAKSVVKIKHLGLISTGKFASIFCFIFSTLMLLFWGIIFGVMMLFSMLIGASLGGVRALLGMVMGAGMGALGFLVGAVAFVLIYTVLGFVIGILGAFAFNTVVKISGGLTFDAEIA